MDFIKEKTNLIVFFRFNVGFFVKNNEYSFPFSFAKETIQILDIFFVAGIK